MLARSRRSMASVNRPSASLVVGEQGSRTRHRTQPPVGSAGARALLEARQGRGGGFPVAECVPRLRSVRRGTSCRSRDPRIHSTHGRPRSASSYRPRPLKRTAAVNPLSPTNRPSPLAIPSAAAASIKSDRVGGNPPPGGEIQRVILHRRVAGRRGDRVGLFDKPCRRGEFAPVHVDAGPVGERRWQHRQRAGVTCAPDHVGGDLLQDRVVPEFVRGGFLRDRERPHRAVGRRLAARGRSTSSSAERR